MEELGAKFKSLFSKDKPAAAASSSSGKGFKGQGHRLGTAQVRSVFWGHAAQKICMFLHGHGLASSLHLPQVWAPCVATKKPSLWACFPWRWPR